MVILTFTGFIPDVTAQDSLVVVRGRVKDYVSGAPIHPVRIQARDLEDSSFVVIATVGDSSKYVMVLNRISRYAIYYESPGRVTKHVTIDMRGPTSEDWLAGFGVTIDMTLFYPLADVDFSILDEPIGKCAYDTVTANFTWDLEYTETVRRRVRDLIEYYDKQYQQEQVPMR